MSKYKVTVVVASSVAAMLSVCGIALASGAAADGHSRAQGSLVLVGRARAGNGDSFNGGVNAGPSSEATAIGGDGGRGGRGGEGGDVRGGEDRGGVGNWGDTNTGFDSSSGRPGEGGWGGHGDSGGEAGAASDAQGGGNAASQASVNNAGNSANTNVASVNAEVNPEFRVRDTSTNAVVSSNDNHNDNDNRNDNDADADADADASNANINVNIAVNELENGSEPNPPPGSSPLVGQARCESYGGTFNARVGSFLWTCTGLPELSGPARVARADDLAAACIADRGAGFFQQTSAPQDAFCL